MMIILIYFLISWGNYTFQSEISWQYIANNSNIPSAKIYEVRLIWFEKPQNCGKVENKVQETVKVADILYQVFI